MPDLIPTASLVLAACALVISLVNARTAKKALAVADAQEQRRNAAVRCQVEDMVGWVRDGQRYAAVKVLLTNASDRDGSVTRVSFDVHYAGQPPMILQLSPTADALFETLEGDRLVLPLNLSANSSALGWVAFRIDATSAGRRVDDYELAVTDSRGPVARTTVWPLRELS